MRVTTMKLTTTKMTEEKTTRPRPLVIMLQQDERGRTEITKKFSMTVRTRTLLT
jgi:hypothetical protein